MYYLSISDLIKVKGFAEVYGTGDVETINKILYENGMDVRKGVKEVVCNHRNLQGDEVYCMRYEGKERGDRNWKDTGAATLDAWIYGEGSNLKGLAQELHSMSREPSLHEGLVRTLKDNREKEN